MLSSLYKNTNMTNTISITMLMILLCLGNICVSSNAQVSKDIFVLAGQSNMAGRGGVINNRWDGFVPPECRPNPDIFRLNAQNSWVAAHEPLHEDIDVGKTCGVGPGLAFANSLQLLSRSKFHAVGLVPCAVGGTKISQWARGTPLYSQLVTRAKAAVQSGGTIRAVLWYQGESDTNKIEDAKAYKDNMEKFISHLRLDLGVPSLLIIQVALASGEGKHVEMVREAQLGIKLPKVKSVDAKGLRVGSDHLHLTTMSQVHLGLLLARSFLNNIPKHHDPLISTTSNSSLV
ncbi:hypothetical protein RDABS01_010594 [Bienertia sinuspersici]